MVFSSLLFLFRFLPIVLLLYFAAPKRYRNGVLFAASLVFYGWGEPVYILLLLFSTLVDYFHGLMVERCLERGSRAGARAAVISSAVLNLGLLGFFKYSDFTIAAVNRLLSLELPLPGLALPVGISFYTFQSMSYTIDVYRGQAKIQKNPIDFGAYVSMFPQLVAGPIVRYSDVARELNHRKESVSLFAEGVSRFVIGLGKKVLIANQIGAVWEEVLAAAPGEKSVLLMWIGILAFGLQIYFDFSGYSDMAIGLGKMLGFYFPENFRYPYESKSITEFWRRWHISLGTWFKEYVYYPLGGSRKGPKKQLRNILIVWLLTGIWHGAGWNFLLWGLWFGLLLLAEKSFLLTVLERLPGFVRWLYAMLAVFIGWVLFSIDSMAGVVLYLKQMFGFADLAFANDRAIYLLCSNLVLFAAAVIGAGSLPAAFIGEHVTKTIRMILEPVFVAAVFLLSVSCLVSAGYNPFLYFRF